MSKHGLKRIISLTVSLVMVLGLNNNSGVLAADTDYGNRRGGLERPIVIVNEITEEEYDKAVAEEKQEIRHDSVKNTDNYWSQFSKPYYSYQKGLNDKQIALYDKMYSKLYSMIEGGEALTEMIWGDRYLTPAFSYSGLSEEQAGFVALLLAYEHPELYYLNSGLKINEVPGTNKGTAQLTVYTDFKNGSDRMRAAADIKSRIEWYRGQITGTTAYEREKSIQDLICNNTSYDRGRYDQSCASVFLDGTTVCAGYSEAFELLCNAEGIPAISVTSNFHQWNQVKLDGRWYAVDVTWDDAGLGDPAKSDSVYDYFNISDRTLKEDDDYSKEMHTIEEYPWFYTGRPSCCYDYPGIEKHDWMEATYTWSDDNKTCTATRVCMGDKSHKETEEGTVTSRVVRTRTANSMETIEYTATFKNDDFKTQTKRATKSYLGLSSTDVTIAEDKEVHVSFPKNKYAVVRSGNTKVATVSYDRNKGKLTIKGKNPGKTYIKVKSGKTTERVTVTVNYRPLTVNKESVTVNYNKNKKATVTTLKNKNIEVSSSDPKIAVAKYIKSSGEIIIQGKKKGDAVITVSRKGTQPRYVVVTVEAMTTGVRVADNVSLKPGKYTKLKVTAAPKRSITGDSVTVKSNNEGIATAKFDDKKDKIKISAVSKGRTCVTVKVGKIKKTINVKVR